MERVTVWLLALSFGLFPALAAANPQGGQVVGGIATITTVTPTQLNVQQQSNRAVIDWQSFNIKAGEKTQFIQPSSSSVALNRVQVGNPSTIAGQLSANGQIVLVNPSGIVFSRGSQVDVNSLIASTANITNQNFMAGIMKFDQASPVPGAAIVNQGTISVAKSGLAALVAPQVANSGVIAAHLGKVVLGGTETWAVDFYGDGLMNFVVDKPVTAAPAGATSLVSNQGTIDAPGGTVLLSANAAAGILANVVNMGGEVNAPTAVAAGGAAAPGRVKIDAGAGNGALVSGTINVSGTAPGQTGGTAQVTGGSVTLAPTARIAATGDSGGGTVEVGGGLHGANPTLANARTTTVQAGARIDASATGSGNGGTVAVWSDGTTVFNGTILAKGGLTGGDGGFVETSGQARLSIGAAATVSTPASTGKTGTWLLDPADIFISTSGANLTLGARA